LNEHRLAEAARMLRSSDAKVLAVAQDVGFESLSNFNHQFRIRYGVTPREYRTGK
ncbi:MAG: helix-turn-helix domain-containing protein, partial [Bacteroidaceae bacterium]|nr:helix-turn-helix domain-containing protein [Bacteroidaceae bacterium]